MGNMSQSLEKDIYDGVTSDGKKITLIFNEDGLLKVANASSEEYHYKKVKLPSILKNN